MTEGYEEGRDPVGTRVLLECGHRLALPWNVAPEAAVADLLRHRATCGSEASSEFVSGGWSSIPAWLPVPEARR
jgi:hypothetical protein